MSPSALLPRRLSRKVLAEHGVPEKTRKEFRHQKTVRGGNMATAGFKAMTEFCEQVNPRILLEMRRARSLAEMPDQAQSDMAPSEMRRVQDSWSAAAETRALVWMAARTPASITPDYLTALGLAAQVGAGACYALASWNRYWLLGVNACLTLNWLGDSLDGTLARVRQRLRPRYGFYVDHMVDTVGALALMGGLALSGYMHPWIAMGLLVAFLLLSIQTYLATYALGEFRLSFWRFGPTELRILLVLGNLALLWKPVIHFLGGKYRPFDVGGAIGLAGMGLMLVVFTIENTVRLYRKERITQ
jgi:archaetidylinositol phosphate synthase